MINSFCYFIAYIFMYTYISCVVVVRILLCEWIIFCCCFLPYIFLKKQSYKMKCLFFVAILAVPNPRSSLLIVDWLKCSTRKNHFWFAYFASTTNNSQQTANIMVHTVHTHVEYTSHLIKYNSLLFLFFPFFQSSVHMMVMHLNFCAYKLLMSN